MSVFTITFCIWSNYLYEGSEYKFNISFVIFNLLYIILYFCWGTYVFENTLSSINTYSEYEKNACDASYLINLKREFENEYYGQPNQNKIDKEKLSYLMMRQNFISPIGLPVLKEMYLRGDFNFAFYLGHWLSSYLSKSVFSVDLFSYLISVLITASFYFCSEASAWSLWLLIFGLILCSLLFWLKVHLSFVLKCITPRIESPQDINFEINLDSRDPFQTNWNIALFECIDSENDIDDEKLEPIEENKQADERESIGVISKGSLDLKFNDDEVLKNSEFDSIIHEDQWRTKNIFKVGGIFWRMKHNRQQRLFYLGRCGIFLFQYFIKGIFQIALALTSYASLYLFQCMFMSQSELRKSKANIYLNIGLLLTTICVMALLYPKVVFLFMKVNSIQMMKKSEFIDETTKYQRNIRSNRSFRIYKGFKQIRRQLIEDKKEDIHSRALRYSMKKIVEENFKLCWEHPTNKMFIQNIEIFAHLCGWTSINMEDHYFMFLSANAKLGYIDFLGLMMEIEKKTNDVKIDPYDVIVAVMYYWMNKKTHLSIESYKEFFQSRINHFDIEDVREIIKELLCIQRSSGIIDVKEFASLIRDDIYNYPK